MTKIRLILIYVSILTVLGSAIKAQIPYDYRIERIIYNSMAVELENHDVLIRLTVFDDMVNKTPVYQEIHKLKSDSEGMVYVSLGEGYVVEGVFDSLKLIKKFYMISEDLDILDGNGYSYLGSKYLFFKDIAHASTKEIKNKNVIVELIDFDFRNYYANLSSIVKDETKAGFMSENRIGSCPLTVQFHDLSTDNAGFWFWEFGDDYSSSKQNPIHIYHEPGEYTVRLTVLSPFGAAKVVKEGYIVVTE